MNWLGNLMIKKTIAALVLVGAMSGCSDPDSDWLYDGSSVGLDRQQWSEAQPGRKLGTAGFWLRNLNKDGWLIDGALVEGPEFKQNAQMLVDCLDSSIIVSKAETNHLVASCVQTMGWGANKS